MSLFSLHAVCVMNVISKEGRLQKPTAPHTRTNKLHPSRAAAAANTNAFPTTRRERVGGQTNENKSARVSSQLLNHRRNNAPG